jgi:hypothetical protein
MSIIGKFIHILKPSGMSVGSSHSTPVKLSGSYSDNPLKKGQIKDSVKFELGIREEVNQYLETLNDWQLYALSFPTDMSFVDLWRSGHKEIQRGQVLRRLSKLADKTSGGIHSLELEEAITTGEYQKYPFESSLESELRALILSKLTPEDSPERLISYIKSQLISVCSHEDSQTLIKYLNQLPKVCFERNERIRELTSSILGKGKESSGVIDILSLKSLALALSGEEMNSLSMAPASFAFCALDLVNNSPSKSIVFKTKNRKLVEIKLYNWCELKKEANGERPYSSFSPVFSAVPVIFTQSAKQVEYEFEALDKTKRKSTKAVIYNENVLSPDEEVFVLIRGGVAKEKGTHYRGYSAFANNTETIKATEIYNFKSIDGELIETRIGFIPDSSSEFPEIFRHGGIIFGVSDQTYHSCYLPAEKNSMWSVSTIDRYKQYWSGRQKEESFSSAVIASKINYFLTDKEGKSTSSTDIFKEEHQEVLKRTIQSISEVNEFTLQEVKYFLPLIWYFNTPPKDLLEKLTKNYAPLSQRWNVQTYMKDGIGITKEKQNTFYTMLSKKMRNAERMEWFREWAKIKASGE